MNNNQKILLALFTGIAAGAAAAILLNTEKGKDTRSKLSYWTKDVLFASKEKLSNLKASAKAEEETEETALGI